MTTQDDAATIGRLMEQWQQAIHDRSAEAAVAVAAPDIRVFSLAPPLEAHGTEALARALSGWFATWDGPIEEEVQALDLHVGGDVAWASGLARMAGRKRDGEAVDLWFRITLGFRRLAGGWRLAHSHASVPFRMDGSLRAEVELRP